MIESIKRSNDKQFISAVIEPGDNTRYKVQIIDKKDILYNGLHITLGNMEYQKQQGICHITSLVLGGLLGNTECIKEHKKHYIMSTLEKDIQEIYNGN